MSFDSFNLRRILPVLRSDDPAEATRLLVDMNVRGQPARDLLAARLVYRYAVSAGSIYASLALAEEGEADTPKFELMRAEVAKKIERAVDDMIDSATESEVLRNALGDDLELDD